MPDIHDGEMKDKALVPGTTSVIVRESTEEDKKIERIRRIRDLMFGAAAMMVAITIFWVIFLVTTKYVDQSDKVNDLVTANIELQSEVTDLTKANNIERETDECFDAYTARITDASSRFQTDGTGKLINMIVQRLLLPDDGDVNLPRNPTDEEFQTALDEAKQFRLNYKTAVEDRQDWVNADKPVPCPIGPVYVGGIYPFPSDTPALPGP